MDDQSPDPTTRTPTPAPTDEPSTTEAVAVSEEPAAGDLAGTTSSPAAVTVPPAAPPPAWEPPRTKRDGGGGRLASVLVGLILLGIGIWFFAEHTLGIDLPTIRWSQLWPIILIVIGGAIVLGALRRDRS